MNQRERWIKRILEARKDLYPQGPRPPLHKCAEEGGCGVVGFAASTPVAGRHIFEPSIQMHNRGNGKGGGIAAAGLSPEQLGVDAATLKNDYIYQIALLDPAAGDEIEQKMVTPGFEVHHKTKIAPAADYRSLGLEVKPPDVVRYFIRAKKDALDKFASERGLTGMSEREVEDEFIYRNSIRLNQTYYASLGDKRAFVMSHARNLVIFKIVGYAENVVKYYGLDDFRANVWIAHQRYPTKGRVWHPGGSHPFIGMNEALVHNGDFANYYAVSEYLRQRNLEPQFLTDTEVSVQLFDLWSRIYRYPLECVIEAMAPTTELDLDRLPEDKQKLYKAIQSLHVHCSPDGPWFFIIAQSQPDQDLYRLLGITDTAMLRPQVFAIQEGDVSIGLVASEKQAIDATLQSLAADDKRFRAVADRYWNARGGSYADGGAFGFTVHANNGHSTLTCADKFGRVIRAPEGEYRINLDAPPTAPQDGDALLDSIINDLAAGESLKAFKTASPAILSFNLDNLRWLVEQLLEKGGDPNRILELLTLLNDRRFDCGQIKRSALLEVVRRGIDRLLDATPPLNGEGPGEMRRIDWTSRGSLRAPRPGEKTLVVCARGFEPEGDDRDSQLEVKAYQLGWRRFIVYGLKGQRFHGCGMGPGTRDVRLDIYGASGDYLASGIDGMSIHVHDNGQDQLAQIMKFGELVVHGDVGQAFMYGAKGGRVFVLGNAAGRPLINAVGRPRVVINGTALDFLAESFMAGDPHMGGGFVILNGVEFDGHGNLVEMKEPYPGSNLFSLASGGCLFVRDPRRKLVPEQLNGGEFADLTDEDWRLMQPCLEANQDHFGVRIDDLLTVDGVKLSPREVYRKVRAVKLAVLAKQRVPE